MLQRTSKFPQFRNKVVFKRFMPVLFLCSPQRLKCLSMIFLLSEESVFRLQVVFIRSFFKCFTINTALLLSMSVDVEIAISTLGEFSLMKVFGWAIYSKFLSICSNSSICSGMKNYKLWIIGRTQSYNSSRVAPESVPTFTDHPFDGLLSSVPLGTEFSSATQVPGG